MELIRSRHNLWDPFEMLSDLQADMNKAFSRSLTRDRAGRSFEPDIEVTEDANQYTLRADLPGMKKEDFEISVQGSLLSLKGERKQEKETKEKGTYYSERFYGSFTRTMEFPAEIKADGVKAAYKDGVLEITLPKSENAKPKQINVDVK